MHWYPAYIGLGSNLAEPTAQITTAFDLLAAMPGSRLISRSSLYRSAALGDLEQPEFVNAVAAILTQLGPEPLLSELHRIEDQRGRTRELHWGPRTLDLDLLLYASTIIDTDTLKVPHPGIAERNFVLLPLREVAPGLTIPRLGPIQHIEVNHHEPAILRIG